MHGEDGLQAAQRITRSLFDGDLSALSETDCRQLKQDGLPSSTLVRAEMPGTVTQLLAEAGMTQSGKQVKDALMSGAVLVNGDALGWSDNASPSACLAPERALHGRFYVVRLGKKKYHLFDVA